MATGLPDLPHLVRLSGLAEAVFADLPAWLWDVDGGRILFANAAGVSFFGEKHLPALTARRFDMRRPGLAQFEAVAAALPEDGAEQLAMLRFLIGPNTAAIACSCRLVRLGEAQAAVAVCATVGSPDRRSLESRAGIMFDSLDMPVAVVREGEVIYANKAADDPSPLDGIGFDLASPEGPVRLLFGIGPGQEDEPGASPGREGSEAPAAGASGDEGGGREGSPRRFAFVLDAESRFTEIGPALASAVGPDSANLAGRRWPEIADALGVDPQGQIAAALDNGDTWSGIELDWPRDKGGHARIRLSALPRFGPGRVLIGYRGFGEVVSVETSGPPAGAAVIEAEMPAPERGQSARPNVVPLRPGRPVAVVNGLNDQERTAFRAIAEALGARMEGEAPADGPAEQDGPEEPRSLPVEDVKNGPAETAQQAGNPSPAQEASETPRASKAETAAGRGGGKPAAPAEVLQSLLDCLPIGVAVVRDQAVLHANRAFLDMFDYADLEDLEIAGGLAAILDGRSAGEGSVAGRRRDGTPVMLESRIGRVKWSDGPALFVTAREIAEEAKEPAPGDADEVAELRAILDTASDGVVVLDSDGTILGINRSAEALFEREAGEVVGQAFRELVADESRAAVSDYLDGLASGGVMSVLNDGREIVARTRRGGDLPLFLTIGRIGEGEPARFCAVMRDITEWKTAEAELVAARRRAEEASAQKSDFLAGMSHEIRTPLNAIIGFAEVMADERFGPMANERYLQYAKDIRQSGEHIISLVNDLLDLAKIEAGKLEMSFTGVSLNDIAEQAIAIMQPQANTDRVIIRSSLARNLPPVVADARSIRQVMLNLLSNAIKFTPAGGQVIVTTMAGDGGEVVLRIRDTGTGMSESEVQIALEPFRQLPVRSDKERQGTGLGLPLTRALLDANRAGFAIRSRINEGTLVEVSFPHSRVLAE